MCALVREGGEGRDGDKRRGATIRAVGCGSVVRRIHVSAGPPAPWVLGSLVSFCLVCGGSLGHCGFVIFLALGRGAVAAAEFISLSTSQVFIINSQVHSLIWVQCSG